MTVKELADRASMTCRGCCFQGDKATVTAAWEAAKASAHERRCVVSCSSSAANNTSTTLPLL